MCLRGGGDEGGGGRGGGIPSNNLSRVLLSLSGEGGAMEHATKALQMVCPCAIPAPIRVMCPMLRISS